VRTAREGGVLEQQELGVALPLCRRGLDEDVPQGRRARRRRREHRPRERPLAGARIDDDERVGRPELAPPRVERSRQHRTEQRPDLGTREEMAARRAARSPAARGVEAALGVVERELDRIDERDRPPAIDLADDATMRRPRHPSSAHERGEVAVP
jgi:hypothetical protein